VGGTGVAITTTGVGGMEVLVGSAPTAAPVVVVGTTGTWVTAGGGLLLAGNLQAEVINASIMSSPHVKMIFLFMVASLAPNANIPMMIFYIILRIALYC
jgi:hypothetical protein